MIDNFYINCIGTGINEIGTGSPFHMYPNTEAGLFPISSYNPLTIYSVVILNNLRQTILTTNETKIDLSKFEAGIYFAVITTDKRKLIE